MPDGYIHSVVQEALAQSRGEFATLHRENEILLQRLAKLENAFEQCKLLAKEAQK